MSGAVVWTPLVLDKNHRNAHDQHTDFGTRAAGPEDHIRQVVTTAHIRTTAAMSNHQTGDHMNRTFRLAGWLAVAGLLGATLLVPASALAHDTKEPWPTESVPVETESAPVETRSAPAETESAPVETRSAPVETESAPVETESAPVETESAPVETESAPVETESVPVQTEPTCQDEQGSDECETPVGSVDAETGTPNEDVTPPSTDTLTPTNTPSSDGWQLVLLALAAMLSTALILTPASRKARRR